MGSIIKFFDSIGEVCSGIVSCFPDFLRPVALVFILISAIYLIVGRD